MDRVASIERWLREMLAAQPWLAPVQPYLSHTPDWALLAAPTFIVLLMVWALFHPRRNTKKKPNARGSRQPSAVPERLRLQPTRTGPATPPPTPAPLPTPQPIAATPTTKKPAPRDDDDTSAVRVFVSSTFLDMQRERDILVKEIFPALRARIRARGVELLAVDLRWGITQEQSERGETLPTLLAEIDRCRPYFIGLIGDRYGWVPPVTALTEELKATYPSIADAAERSVTEMEVLHGVLRNPDTAERALFFERDPNWNWKATLSEADRAKVPAETEADRAKLIELKAAVHARVPHIQTYREPSEIGGKVMKALGDALDARFPESQAPDAYTQTMRLHAAYARERRGLYIGSGAYRAALDQWMARKDTPPMLITGASGGGKSTLVANWLHAWRNDHPDDIVFEHYLGASPDSADPMLVMRRLWEHLNRVTGEAVDLPAGNVELMDVASGLAQRIAQANVFAERNDGSILITLDGLDKLSSQQNLRWLLNVPRVKLLASGLDGEAKTAALSRGWRTLEVNPLTEAERGEFIEQTLAGWGRKLLSGQIAAILARPLSGSPLFLKTVLDELRVSANNALLQQQLDYYLQARDLTDLFARVLGRLDEDCEPELVGKALPLIWASRAGLEESEIIAITGATPLAWAVLRNGLGDGLRDQAGRLAFSHDYLNQAVEVRYLATDEKKRAAHLAIADQFEKREPDERQAEELPYQLRAAEAWERLEALLVDLDRFDLLCARGDGELWSYWPPLEEKGRDPEALLCGAFEARAGEAEEWSQADVDFWPSLEAFLSLARAKGDAFLRLGERYTAACERILGPEDPRTLISISGIASTLLERGDLGRAQTYLERALEAHTRTLGPEHPWTLSSMSHLANALSERGDLEGAQSYYERVLEARTRILGPEHPDTLTSMKSLAGVLFAMTRNLDPEDPRTLTSEDNYASALRANGDPRGAQFYQERVLEARTRILGPEHPDTLTSMLNLAATLADRGDIAGALQRAEHVLTVATRQFGGEHPLSRNASDWVAGIKEEIEERPKH